MTPECIGRLLELSEGNPRYIIRIASTALQLGREQGAITAREIEEAGRQIIREMGRDRFDRLKSDEREIILTIAGYQPLNISEIQERLESDYDLSTVSRKVRALADRGYIDLEVRGNEKICRLRRAIYEYTRDLV